MKTYLFTIDAITNLQVGSGAVNFGVIDNLVQRDAATGFPAINASSLKGALRQHCEEHWRNEPDKKLAQITSLFGTASKSETKNAGSLRFFDANLLSMPVRSSHVPYQMCSCPSLIRDYIEKREMFGIRLGDKDIVSLESLMNMASDGRAIAMAMTHSGTMLEDCENQTLCVGGGHEKDVAVFADLVGKPATLLSDGEMSRLCDDDHLPVLARNCLEENNRNLWYEQVLPRFSRLYFLMVDTAEKDESADVKCFIEAITAHAVQIGANASVGYGFCKIRRVSENNQK